MGYPNPEIISPAHLRSILSRPTDYRWRAHGIGMLRLNLSPDSTDWRINLWHPRLLNDGISTMHTHPWAFDSYILAGELTNKRFTRLSDKPAGLTINPPGQAPRMPWRYPMEQYWEGRIPCGAHAPQDHEFGIEGEPCKVWLQEERPEVYTHGAQYRQAPEEIHDTRAEPGTITIMHRTYYDPSGRASVFWPVGSPWGDATRETTEEDILVTCAAALEQLNKTPWRT